MKEKLNKIAEQYIKEYNLNIMVDIVQEGFTCYFNYHKNYIFFSIDYVKNYPVDNAIKRSGYMNFENHLIFAILHEIYHAIDYRNDCIRFKQEYNNVNFRLYKTDLDYHNSIPFEQRADEFAIKEIKKWV